MPPERKPAQYDAHSLLHALARAQRAGNASLQALAETGTQEQRCASQAGFRYQMADAPAQRVIAAALFHRPYAMHLECLELAINGYCAERQFGWERRRETVFTTQPPAWWRRLLRPAPMLVLRIAIDAGAGRIVFDAARDGIKPNRSRYLVRLEPDMQAELAHVHRRQVAVRRTLRTRFLAWCGNAFRRSATAPETDM
ncbi:hypothetical protein SAMN05518865_12919 [Duganella sp. CF458]|uniref:hypothetical protein n=1 Tax=Duganella sp. CF458 TaxID=1884368 RepID=UPI0008E044BC|nr:hypothetical protein [Duganella sp. CF458]SFH00754.1 hypothetical protein SAMN05518865_12919 [Duganella sp. CF458]